jgi:pilus assembly protein TadC
MTDQDRAALIQGIKKTQENIAITIGIVVIFILLFYFFTYAQLATAGWTGLFWAEGITALLWVLVLFRLGPISFFFTRLWLGRRAKYRELLATITRADLSNPS